MNMPEAEVSEEQAGPSENSGEGEDQESDNNKDPRANFECNICLDTAKDAVVSVCGHLFW